MDVRDDFNLENSTSANSSLKVADFYLFCWRGSEVIGNLCLSEVSVDCALTVAESDLWISKQYSSIICDAWPLYSHHTIAE